MNALKNLLRRAAWAGIAVIVVIGALYVALQPAAVTRFDKLAPVHRQGWQDFHDLRIRRKALVFKATRRNGLIYKLRVDRCSGTLLRAALDWGQYWSLLDRD